MPALELGIGLLPSHRDRGIGSGLIRWSLAWARDTRYAQVRLTTHYTNTRAMHVFSRCGFAYARHVGEDLIEMDCNLQAPFDIQRRCNREDECRSGSSRTL